MFSGPRTDQGKHPKKQSYSRSGIIRMARTAQTSIFHNHQNKHLSPKTKDTFDISQPRNKMFLNPGEGGKGHVPEHL